VIKKRRGFMTTELMVVAVVLTILSGISAAAVPSFASKAKRAALSSTLSVVQGATDRFFVESNFYPSVSQPSSSVDAVEISAVSQDPSQKKFVGTYLHSAPNGRSVDYGLNASDGATVYFGVTASGRVFATQTSPTTGKWTLGTITVYTQEDVDGSLTLSSIW